VRLVRKLQGGVEDFNGILKKRREVQEIGDGGVGYYKVESIKDQHFRLSEREKVDEQ